MKECYRRSLRRCATHSTHSCVSSLQHNKHIVCSGYVTVVYVYILTAKTFSRIYEPMCKGRTCNPCKSEYLLNKINMLHELIQQQFHFPHIDVLILTFTFKEILV